MPSSSAVAIAELYPSIASNSSIIRLLITPAIPSSGPTVGVSGVVSVVVTSPKCSSSKDSFLTVESYSKYSSSMFFSYSLISSIVIHSGFGSSLSYIALI